MGSNPAQGIKSFSSNENVIQNPLVILSGGKDALLARETFVTDLYIYMYVTGKFEIQVEMISIQVNLILTWVEIESTKHNKNLINCSQVRVYW